MLAALFGIHRKTVTAVLQQLGVEPGQPGLSAEQVAEACRLCPEGWSLARRAERYDGTDMTVRRYLLLAGLAMRLPTSVGTDRGSLQQSGMSVVRNRRLDELHEGLERGLRPSPVSANWAFTSPFTEHLPQYQGHDDCVV